MSETPTVVDVPVHSSEEIPNYRKPYNTARASGVTRLAHGDCCGLWVVLWEDLFQLPRTLWMLTDLHMPRDCVLS